MTRPLNLDRNKAAAIVAEWLEERPALARTLARDEVTKLNWTPRADLEADDWVWLSVLAPSGESIAIWHGPRAFVELPEPGRGLH